jgi:NADH pyrophosphatase NudC (nudix superfamily)
MTLLAAAVAVVAITTLYTLFVRAKDLPQPEPESPTKHLEERKAAIYENLRDLQFEYRVGKLSDADYQTTKLNLQKELAVVLAGIDKVPVATKVVAPAAKPAAAYACAHCGASFDHAMKFCGECGKAMA